MKYPVPDDTIVAVASGWRASPIGIVRLSGPRAREIVATIGVQVGHATDHRPWMGEATLVLDAEASLAVTVFLFPAPRSYTGQDVIELHAPGCLPLLRELTARLVAVGARRALPGEFTARAYLHGKLDADRVSGIYGLIHAGGADAARSAARLAAGRSRRAIHEIGARLVDLLARVEAGIDFSDEEDVRFISACDLRVEIQQLREALACVGTDRFDQRRERPHVALAGLPNAGKSSLFNALLGTRRAIVSPVIGTTRDVLSAVVEMGGVEVVLQDTAGLGAATDDLELAARVASEAACDQADVVLWVHACTSDWPPHERTAVERIAFERRVLVQTKTDRAPPSPPPVAFRTSAATSVLNKTGLGDVLECVVRTLSAQGQESWQGAGAADGRDAALAALTRASSLVEGDRQTVSHPELVAAELRLAVESVRATESRGVTDEVLGLIFSRFCVGK